MSSVNVPYGPIGTDPTPWEWSNLATMSYDRRYGIVGAVGLGARPEWPEEVRDNAKEVILRAGAFETGALEDLYEARPGATITIAKKHEGWEEALESSGHEAPHRFEDQLAGYRLARTFAETGELPVGKTMLRRLHEAATQSQKTYDTNMGPRPLRHGEFKSEPNLTNDRWGRIRHFAPPLDVPAQLDDVFALHDQLVQRETDPISRSAFLHWAIAHVHPFQDGNGRVARILSSVPLFESLGLPIVIFADAKRTYLQALDAADAGEAQAFLDFTYQRMRNIGSWYQELCSTAVRADFETTQHEIEAILLAQETTQEPVLDVARRAQAYLVEEINRLFGEIRIPDLNFEQGGVDSIQTPSALWIPSHEDAASWIVSLHQPFSVSAKDSVGTKPDDYNITVIRGSGLARQGIITLRYEDCSPEIGTEASIRLSAAASDFVNEITSELLTQLTQAARAAGRFPNQQLPPESARRYW